MQCNCWQIVAFYNNAIAFLKSCPVHLGCMDTGEELWAEQGVHVAAVKVPAWKVSSKSLNVLHHPLGKCCFPHGSKLANNSLPEFS